MLYFNYQIVGSGFGLMQYFNDKGFPDFNSNYDIIEKISNENLKESNETNSDFIGMIKQTNQKVLITQFELNENMDFQYEKHFLLKLNHQNIICMLDHQIYGSYGYIIKPYGISLMHILKNIDLDQECWLKIIKEILKVIDYLQRLDITHNNIALQNIIFTVSDINEFIDSKNRINDILRIINFSSAREKMFLTDTNFRSTFPPPEFISDKIISISYDIYSLGYMIYYSITGSHPFLDNKNFLKEEEWNKYPILKQIIKQSLIFEYEKRPSADMLLNSFFID